MRYEFHDIAVFVAPTVVNEGPIIGVKFDPFERLKNAELLAPFGLISGVVLESIPFVENPIKGKFVLTAPVLSDP